MSIRFKKFLLRAGKESEFKPLKNALLNYLKKEAENKYLNYDDGDFWKLMFRIRDGVGTQIDQNNPENDL